MNKTDLINAIASGAGIEKPTAARVWQVIEGLIVEQVAAGEEFSFSGFGKFFRRTTAARVIKNPRTGELLEVPASYSPAFRPGKKFKESVASAEKPATGMQHVRVEEESVA